MFANGLRRGQMVKRISAANPRDPKNIASSDGAIVKDE
jgi:hypothetical protein